jgi:type IV pilus assembly protein PilO
MTQTRKWSIGTGLLVLLLMVASWFLLLAPQRSQAADLDAQASAVVVENDQLQTQIETLKAEQKDLPQWQAELAAIRTEIPPSPALPGLIRELSNMADKAGVSLVSLTPAAPVTLGDVATDPAAAAAPAGATGLVPGSLAGLDVQLAVTGGYFEIQQFVNNLERLQRVFLTTGVTIGEDTAAAAADGTTSAGELAGTVSGRVFLVPPGDPTAAIDPGATTSTSTTTTTGTPPAAQ